MSTFTTLAAGLKKHYYLNASTIPDLTFKKNPLYSMIRKTQWGGESGEWPIIIGHNQSTSADITKAISNADGLQAERWSLPTNASKKHYTVATFPGDLIAAFESKPDVYFPLMTKEIDSAFKTAARRMSIKLYRNGYGGIGRVQNTGFATAVCTLTNPWDAKNFEPRMYCTFAAADVSGATRDTGDRLRVVSVDIDAGTVTFDANLSNIAAIAQNDFIFPEGDRDVGASTTSRNMYGFETFVPYDRTTVGTLFGVDRTKHPTRLAGRYLDGTGKRVTESVTEMLTMLGDVGSTPNAVAMSWKTWLTVEKELGSQVRYGKAGGQGDVFFKSIKFNGGEDDVDIVKDTSCPDNRIYVLNTDTWQILHLGAKGPVRFLDEDDNQMLRSSTADSYELRIGGYVEMLCNAPGENGVIAI